jgi:hypothetical protein
MKSLSTFTIVLMLLVSVLLSACGLLLSGAPIGTAPNGVATAAAQTVVAQMTQLASEASPTPTLMPPTITPTATDEPLQPSTTPSVPPTAAPTFTPTPIPIPCNWAQFIQDVSVKDGSVFNTEASFTKTWRLKNIGSCTWTREYDLVFVSGDHLDGSLSVPLSGNVLPGQTVDVSVKLTAPKKTGSFRGYWQLRNAQGVLFGLGKSANASFWVDIRVSEPDRKTIFNFADEYCQASWRSDVGRLDCPGSSDNHDGFVLKLDNPALENRRENEETLWAHPNYASTGWISGTFPPIKIREGDRFRAWIGCLKDTKGCNVLFQLDYQIEGRPVKSRGEWHEVYDGEVTVLDLDLSDLAGEKVTFILSVIVNNKPAKANGFWFAPRIERIKH